MKLEQTFTVHAPVQTVWEALIDVERVAPCLPGAEVTENVGDGTYKGAFTVKLGPTTAAYTGSLKMESLDEGAHVATMSARGTDKRGQGGANATIVSTVGEDPDGGTKVDVVTDFSITGKLARFGRGGMIQDVANRMLREFAANLEEEVQAGGAVPVVDPAGAAAPDAAEEAGAVGTIDAPADPAGQPPPVAAPRTARAPAKPISAFRLILGALWDRIKRLFRRRRRPRGRT
jgi:carbon monoxide dehydrogenase subunit G